MIKLDCIISPYPHVTIINHFSQLWLPWYVGELSIQSPVYRKTTVVMHELEALRGIYD